jgi:hypothetical protein
VIDCHKRVRFRQRVILLIAMVGACQPPYPASLTKDSTLVLNDGPTANTPILHFGLDSPVVVLGANDREEYDLGPAPTAIFLTDGRIVIGDMYRWPLRVFSPSGTFLKGFQQGGGPQEIPSQSATALRSAGDSVLILSGGRQPVRLLGPDLTVARTIVDAYRAGEIVAKLPDGRIISIIPVETKGQADSFNIVIWFPDISSPRTLTGFRLWSYDIDKIPVFPAAAIWAIRDTVVYLAFNHEPEIEVRDTGGKTVRRIRVNLVRKKLDASNRRDYFRDLEKYYARLGRSVSTEERERTIFADSLPLFERLTVAADGRLWALLFKRRDVDSAAFLILDGDGRLIGTASLPPGYAFEDAIGDRAIVRSTDDNGGAVLKVVPLRSR